MFFCFNSFFRNNSFFQKCPDDTGQEDKKVIHRSSFSSKDHLVKYCLYIEHRIMYHYIHIHIERQTDRQISANVRVFGEYEIMSSENFEFVFFFSFSVALYLFLGLISLDRTSRLWCIKLIKIGLYFVSDSREKIFRFFLFSIMFCWIIINVFRCVEIIPHFSLS